MCWWVMNAEDFNIDRVYFDKMNNKIFFQWKKYISTALDSSKYNLDCDNWKWIILVEGNNICVKDVPEEFLEYVLRSELKSFELSEDIKYEEELSDISDVFKYDYIKWKEKFHKNMSNFCFKNQEYLKLFNRHKDLSLHFKTKNIEMALNKIKLPIRGNLESIIEQQWV